MFPFAPLPPSKLDFDQPASRGFEIRPKSRLELQQALLEHKKMYTVDYLDLTSYYSDRLAGLEHRRHIAESRENRPVSLARLRNMVARVLIVTGERIRPDDAAGERAFNA